MNIFDIHFAIRSFDSEVRSFPLLPTSHKLVERKSVSVYTQFLRWSSTANYNHHFFFYNQFSSIWFDSVASFSLWAKEKNHTNIEWKALCTFFLLSSVHLFLCFKWISHEIQKGKWRWKLGLMIAIGQNWMVKSNGRHSRFHLEWIQLNVTFFFTSPFFDVLRWPSAWW